VVQVHRDGNRRETDCRFDKFLEINRVGVITGAFGNLQHHRRFLFLAGLHDRLQKFHIVDVERAKGVLPLQSFCEQFFSVS